MKDKDQLKIKEAVTDALKEVFTEGDTKDPEMKILIRRIPILCTNVEAMHKSIADIQNNLTWVVRTVIGGVIIAILTLFIK